MLPPKRLVPFFQSTQCRGFENRAVLRGSRQLAPATAYGKVQDILFEGAVGEEGRRERSVLAKRAMKREPNVRHFSSRVRRLVDY